MAEVAILPTSTARVLVVDDEPSITDAVATALRYEGFETMEVGAGRAAELAIDEFRPDLIVLDVMLPDLDGFAIARRLRDGNHRVPVIFLTAKDATEDKVAGPRTRRRLRDQAVQPRRDRGARADGSPADPRRRRGADALRRPHVGRGDP